MLQAGRKVQGPIEQMTASTIFGENQEISNVICTCRTCRRPDGAWIFALREYRMSAGTSSYAQCNGAVAVWKTWLALNCYFVILGFFTSQLTFPELSKKEWLLSSHIKRF